jgi:hypothetical protein
MSDDRQDYFAPDSLHGREVFFHNVRAGTVLDLSSGEISFWYSLHALLTGLSAGSSTYGTKCQGWSFNGSNAQKWRLEKVNLEQAQSPWTIRNVESGSKFLHTPISIAFILTSALCVAFMDLNGGNSDDGTQIHGWHRNDGRNVASEWFLITQEENNPSIFM